jgi:hypothetical protein
MGFRELELFNLVLLGKHGWRFLNNPDTLCSRVLKGRYYPQTDFLHATVSNKPSATWRAIVAGKDALQLGLIKRIGDGASTSVWHDKWIPGIQTMQPSMQLGEEDEKEELTIVSELFDQEIGCWNIELVRRNFIAPEADAILDIPLRRDGGEDFWAWSLEWT